MATTTRYDAKKVVGLEKFEVAILLEGLAALEAQWKATEGLPVWILEEASQSIEGLKVRLEALKQKWDV